VLESPQRPRPQGERRSRLPAAPLACLLVAILLQLSPIRAAVVPWMSLEEMTRQAEVIGLGTVQATASGWSDDGRIIITRVTLRVERVLKGGPRATLVLETPGGRIGDLGMIASGAPVFMKGERVVVFLQTPGDGTRDRSGHLAVVGWSQGRLDVVRDPRTGRDLVVDRPGGSTYVDGSGRPVDPGQRGGGPVELAGFLRDVERLLSGPPPAHAP
jgi:hypothetical protein